MIKAYLFDLDSTLLQMDQDKFLEIYFNKVAEYAKRIGLEPKKFMELFGKAAFSIVKNDGKVTNSEVFWSQIRDYYDEEDLKKKFDSFYRTEFNDLSIIVNRTETPKLIIDKLEMDGYRLVLATNPLFPRVAQMKRLSWTGVDASKFEFITDYENSRYCKPNPNYYKELLNKLNLNPDEVIMVGNDIDDDFSGALPGMKKILITDYLLNRNDKCIEEDEDLKIMTLDEFYYSLIK